LPTDIASAYGAFRSGWERPHAADYPDRIVALNLFECFLQALDA